MTDDKPYRPNVGIALFNVAGQVLIAGAFGTMDQKSFFRGWNGRCRRVALMPAKIRARP